MSAEITVLAWAGLLWVVQLVLYAIPANIQLGPDYTMSPRDEGRRLEGMAGRLQRAHQNLTEGLVIYTVAAVAVTLSGAATPFTTGCAWVFLAARVIYVPLYAFGLAPWRSLVWAVGFFATLAMLVAALP